MPSFAAFVGFKPYLVLSRFLGYSRGKTPLKTPGFPHAGRGPLCARGCGQGDAFLPPPKTI